MLSRIALQAPAVPHGSDAVFIVGNAQSPVSFLEVQNIWAMRKSRLDYFPDRLFADPAWDILLFMYAAKLAGRRSSVKDAVYGSNVPEATALRWIARLEDAGLCDRTADPLDRRRQFVGLTASGVKTMDSYFEAMRRTDAERLAAAA